MGDSGIPTLGLPRGGRTGERTDRSDGPGMAVDRPDALSWQLAARHSFAVSTPSEEGLQQVQALARQDPFLDF